MNNANQAANIKNPYIISLSQDHEEPRSLTHYLPWAFYRNDEDQLRVSSLIGSQALVSILGCWVQFSVEQSIVFYLWNLDFQYLRKLILEMCQMYNILAIGIYLSDTNVPGLTPDGNFRQTWPSGDWSPVLFRHCTPTWDKLCGLEEQLRGGLSGDMNLIRFFVAIGLRITSLQGMYLVHNTKRHKATNREMDLMHSKLAVQWAYHFRRIALETRWSDLEPKR